MCVDWIANPDDVGRRAKVTRRNATGYDGDGLQAGLQARPSSIGLQI